jgi:hypothetical protein
MGVWARSEVVMRARDRHQSKLPFVHPVLPVPWLFAFALVTGCGATMTAPSAAPSDGQLSVFREAATSDPHAMVTVQMSYADDRPVWGVQRIAANGQWLPLPDDPNGRSFRVPWGTLEMRLQTIHLAKKEPPPRILLPTGARTMGGLLEYPACNGYACVDKRRFQSIQVTPDGREQVWWSDPITVSMSDDSESVIDHICEATLSLSVAPGDVVWVDYSSVRDRCWASCSKLAGDASGLHRTRCDVVANPPVLAAHPAPPAESSPIETPSAPPSELSPAPESPPPPPAVESK